MNSAVNRGTPLPPLRSRISSCFCFISSYLVLQFVTDTSAISTNTTCFIILDFSHFRKSPPFPQHKSSPIKLLNRLCSFLNWSMASSSKKKTKPSRPQLVHDLLIELELLPTEIHALCPVIVLPQDYNF